MSFQVSKMSVWAVDLEDRPGAAASHLDALADAGADLEFVLAQNRQNGRARPRLLVSPLRGKKQVDAAESVGFSITADYVGFRVEGNNKPGLGSRIAKTIADHDINIQGLAAVVTGKKFATFLAFENSADADRALKALKRMR